jgi:hypothetical protein
MSKQSTDSCHFCSTPHRITDVRDTRGLLVVSDETFRLWVQETIDIVQGIRPLSQLIISYLMTRYEIGDCMDALDLNEIVYPGIIIGIGHSTDSGFLYHIRYLTYPPYHDMLVDQNGLRPLRERSQIRTCYWGEDDRWVKGDEVLIMRASDATPIELLSEHSMCLDHIAERGPWRFSRRVAQSQYKCVLISAPERSFRTIKLLF